MTLSQKTPSARPKSGNNPGCVEARLGHRHTLSCLALGVHRPALVQERGRAAGRALTVFHGEGSGRGGTYRVWHGRARVHGSGSAQAVAARCMVMPLQCRTRKQEQTSETGANPKVEAYHTDWLAWSAARAATRAQAWMGMFHLLIILCSS